MGVDMSEPTNQSGLSRRAVAKGAAWSVPAVVAVGAAAPAYAISGPRPTVTFVSACKFPGKNNCNGKVEKAYGVTFKVKNNDAVNAIYICSAKMYNIVGTTLTFTFVCPASPCCIKVNAGATVDVGFVFNYNGNSGNQVFTFDFEASWAHSCPCSGDTHGLHPKIVVTGNKVEGTPPSCSCSTFGFPG